MADLRSTCLVGELLECRFARYPQVKSPFFAAAEGEMGRLWLAQVFLNVEENLCSERIGRFFLGELTASIASTPLCSQHLSTAFGDEPIFLPVAASGFLKLLRCLRRGCLLALAWEALLGGDFDFVGRRDVLIDGHDFGFRFEL